MFLSIILGLMADGIAISGRCLKPLSTIIDFRLMLLPYFWLLLLPIAMILTDVIVTIEADVIALF